MQVVLLVQVAFEMSIDEESLPLCGDGRRCILLAYLGMELFWVALSSTAINQGRSCVCSDLPLCKRYGPPSADAMNLSFDST